MRYLLSSLLLVSAAWGQFTSTAGRAAPYTSLPPTCQIGQIFTKTQGSNQGFYACGPTANTFTYISGAGSIVGPAGNSVLNGTGAPGSGTGANGDFYINNTNTCLYGPKASGAWPGSCTALIGPAGPAGPGATPCSTSLISGPDTTKTINFGSTCDGTHINIAYPAYVQIWDNSVPRKSITAGVYQDSSTNNITINFAVGQSNYYVTAIGAIGSACTGASWATLSSGAWTALTSPGWAGLCN